MHSEIHNCTVCAIVLCVGFGEVRHGNIIPKVTGVGVLKTLFKVLQITDVDPEDCVHDITGAGMQFRDFAIEINAKNYSMAIGSLNKGISSLSASVGGWGSRSPSKVGCASACN